MNTPATDADRTEWMARLVYRNKVQAQNSCMLARRAKSSFQEVPLVSDA